MNDPVVKPWSQIDENNAGVLADSIDRELAADARATGPALSRAAWSTLLELAALVPLAGVAVWLLIVLIFGAGRIPVLTGLFLVCCLLISGLLVGHSFRMRRRALSRVNEVMQTGGLAASLNADSADFDEFRPLLTAIEAHVAEIDRRSREVVAHQEAMQIELGLSDARRRQAVAVLDAIGDAIVVTDSFDRLMLANPAAEELFGFDRSTAIRRSVEELIENDKLLRSIRQSRAADMRAAQRRLELSIDGRMFALALSPMSADLASQNEEGGEGRHGVVLVLRDVTRSHEAERKKSEFVAQVAHELRTPLSSIRAYAEMLVDGEAADDKTRKEYYATIQTSADRLGRLIDNMLNISRIEAGTVRVHQEPVAIAPIVQEAVATLRPQAEERQIELNEHLSPVTHQVTADRDLLYQAVLNLLSNAIKYTPEGGNVTVRMTPDDATRTICVEVCDTGVGIPAEDVPRMFEKFFRVEATKKFAKGTGLGLNLVRHIVETVHGGRMTLESEEGKGSTFGMILPLSAR